MCVFIRITVTAFCLCAAPKPFDGLAIPVQIENIQANEVGELLMLCYKFMDLKMRTGTIYTATDERRLPLTDNIASTEMIYKGTAKFVDYGIPVADKTLLDVWANAAYRPLFLEISLRIINVVESVGVFLITKMAIYLESNSISVFVRLWHRRLTSGSTKCLKTKTAIMHLKCAVILFALYFVTATQSMGLNKDQVKKIVKIFKTFKNGTDLSTSALCREYNLVFEHKRGRSPARKVQDLLVFLASNDKINDNPKIQSLSSYEVKIFVGLFNKYDQWFDHSGLLDYDEVKKVVNALNLEDDVEKNLVDKIKYIFNALIRDSVDSILLISSETINAPKFLEAFLEVKPKGKGLDKKRILELINLYKGHKIAGDYIDPVEIAKFFKNLSIVKQEHEGLWFLIPYNGPLYSTDSVRDVLWSFSKYDVNKNGLIDKGELKGIEERHYQDEDIDFIFEDFDIDRDQHLNIAEYCRMEFAEHERMNAEKAEHELIDAEIAEREDTTLKRRIAMTEP
ncbi:uncharacterized protein LOC126842492 [Adelges cooleyi]|uniref:uncharacterized protein LOC126842492 n=1 Tax=Adelges cooleyi TaxID=133065 RepID=UPI00217F7C73|nr:uncharacterized protein LOC126842492 [Adelges cooleyi]